MEEVVLVDFKDNPIGTAEKLQAHVEGKLHRAISVFLFSRGGEMLLQQRAFGKYHSGGLWTNTCCSHPRPGETPRAAAHRRLFEEMGIRCELKKAFDFVYRAELDKGLIEHEYDHVFIGHFEGDPVLNPEEAASFRWVAMDPLLKETEEHPERFTYWFKKILEERSLALLQHLGQVPLLP